jgi:NADPH2:quinone reductase
MHAVVVEQYGDPSVLQWKERPEPKPGPDQIAIRLSMTSVNFADTLGRLGRTNAKLPFIPGLDSAGTVTAVGENVRDFRVGQRVAAFADGGSYAELVLAKSNLAYPLPDDVSDEAAASLVVLVTAWNALTLAGRFTAGETVLVHAGAGGVGSTAIQLARVFGAGKIIATVSDMTKAAYAKECGADAVFDVAKFADGTRDMTGGKGADLILDSVAGPVFDMSLDVLAPFGRYVNYGNASGKPGTLQTNLLHATNRSVIGYSSGHYRNNRPLALRPAVDGAFRAVAEKKVKISASKTFPLKDAAEAHRFIESRKSYGKILLKP